MAYSIGGRREYEFTGNDLNNDPCIFGRGINSWPFRQMTNLTTKQIAKNQSFYYAFPFIYKVNSSLVGIFSDGDAHASSDRQVMIRSDDGGITWSSVVFSDNSTPGVYNTSLLTSLLPTNGDSIVLKVWTIKNNAGVLNVTTQTTVTNGGNTYALWSRAIPGPGGVLYRTGYGTVGSFTETVLAESADAGVTWTYKSTIASSSDSLLYNEADIVNTSGTNWLAIIREETGNNRLLYKATSTDDGATWSATSLLNYLEVNGTQPNLIKSSSGLIVLATGDRSGSTGTTGDPSLQGINHTGISIWTSADSGSTWSYRTNVAAIWSTDGGQPMCNELSTDRVNIVYYGAEVTSTNPVISSVTLDVDLI